MSGAENPRREQSSTYFVQNRSNEDELARLLIQDQLITTSMGGVLPELPDPTIFKRVLDVGCGTGGWLIEVARTYPDISLLVGVDVSKRMLEYARAQAEAQGVSERMEFHVMDALRMLEFPDVAFDLVNQRSAVSYLRTWDWPKLLHEYRRVVRSSGIIRITEPEMATTSSSPALTELFDLMLKAFHEAGHLFTAESDGLTSQLPRLLKQHGFQNIQTRPYTLVARAGTPEAQRGYEDIKYLFRTITPFLQKWGHIPGNYEEIYQQALREMQQPDFVSTSRLLTVWASTA